MDTSIWLILIATAVIFGILGYIGSKYRGKLMDEGKIIRRSSDFVEKAEEFTLLKADPEQVTEAIRTLDYSDMSARMKGNIRQQVFQFAGSTWEAQLCKIGETESQVVYRFEFTSWKTYRGAPQGFLNMNKLTTSVEKMFLRLDPNTQVKEIPLELKTRHSLF
jgi:hypothetical protein